MSLRKRKLAYAAGFALLFLILGIRVKAAEAEGVAGTLQQVTRDVEVKEAPKEDSDSAGTLSAGTAVVVQEQEGSWRRILYQEIKGYIPADALEMYNADQSVELKQEFQETAEEDIRMVDEYELEQKEKRSSMIWGTVIALLVAAIFAVGIISAVKKNREEEAE